MKGRVGRFEDLDAWQVSRRLTNEIYSLTRLPPVSRDFGFVDQIRRAAVSVMNNVAEGFERGSNKEFAKFLFIARGSSGEVRSMLYLAMDQGYVDEAAFESCKELCVRTSQILWGLIKHLQKNTDWRTGLAVSLMIIAPRILLSHLHRF